MARENEADRRAWAAPSTAWGRRNKGGGIVRKLLLALAALVAFSVPAIPDGLSLYPLNSIEVTASSTGTTGSISATLAAATDTTTHICGFVVSSGGTTTPAIGNATITGTVNGPQNFTYVFVSSGQGLLGAALPGCISATGRNVTIVVTVPAGGAGTTVALTVWGYRV